MEQIALLKPNARGTKGPNCPPGAVWLDIAAGLANQDSEKYLNHAAECDHCGPFLREVKEDFADDFTPEEALRVASLPSANTNWQRRLAEALGGTPEDAKREPETSTRLTPAWHGKPFSWKLPVLAAAAIALTVIAISIGVGLLREASVDQLLATAYTERRTLEVRIPGAQHAPLRVERGATGSNLEKPPSLLKAEALISERLQKNPNDPTWLDARARADLLDGNYDSAVKTLLRAQLVSSIPPAYSLTLVLLITCADKAQITPPTTATPSRRWARPLPKTPTIPSPSSTAPWPASSSFSTLRQSTTGNTICV